MKIVGVIPAKSTSTRTPNKNTQEILCIPLFLWAANNLNRVLNKNDIYIDSDCDKILNMARKYGFNTIKRPKELASNATGGNELLLWQASQVDADIYVQHLPTMAFLKESTLMKAINKVEQEGFDSSFAVINDQLYTWDSDGNCEYDLKNIPNSYNLPTITIETMGLYVTTKKSLKETSLRIGKKYAMIPVDKIESIDINYPEELELIRTLAKGLSINSEYLKGIDRLYKNDDIKFIVLDVDGVMTDGGMYYSENGDEFKKFNTKDGMGIKNAVKSGYKIGFLSSGINKKLIKSRAKLLGVEYIYVGSRSKIELLQEWINELGIKFENVAYIGDDINDKEVIKKVGLSASPNDAINEIQEIVDYRLSKSGGDSCVREFIDKFLYIT